jgi:hypothetical protein
VALAREAALLHRHWWAWPALSPSSGNATSKGMEVGAGTERGGGGGRREEEGVGNR